MSSQPARGAPTVSVIVPVHNRRRFIGDAVASLRSQTLQDLEIIVVDDGSTDDSAEVAEKAGGGLARIIRHEENRGIPAARNTGLEAATGRYIAWLDSDDIARPERLERQVRFLDRRIDLALVGSAAGRIDTTKRAKAGIIMPLTEHRAIDPALLFRSPFQQSTIMGRAAILKRFEYRGDFPVCEDLDMFIRVGKRHRLGNMHEVLVDRRIHAEQIGRRESALVRDRKRLLLGDQLDEMGVDYSPDDLDRHVTLGAPKSEPQQTAMIDWSRQWLGRLQSANTRTKRYDADGLRLACALTWATLCRANMRGPRSVAAVRDLVFNSLALGFVGWSGLGWLSEALPTLLLG